MSRKLEIICTSDFIRMTDYGEIDLESSKQAMVEIAGTTRGMKDFEILIDHRKAVLRLSILDIWELLTEMRSYDEFTGRKIALLVSSIGEREEFVKMSAQNQGYWVNVFDNFEEAINWLFLPTDTSPQRPKEQARGKGH